MAKLVHGQWDFEALTAYRAGGGSRWAKFLPPHGDYPSATSLHPMLRGMLSKRLATKMAEERVVMDSDLRDAICALSMVSAGLPIKAGKILPKADILTLMLSLAPDQPFPSKDIMTPFVIKASSLIQQWDADGSTKLHPNAAGDLILNPESWNKWRESIVDHSCAAPSNISSDPPQNASPYPVNGEIHPWAFGGIIDVDVSTGALVNRWGKDLDPNLMSIMLIIISMSAQTAGMRASTLSLLGLGITIITSGGSITKGRLKKVINMMQKETINDNIDFSRDAVIKGWEFYVSSYYGAEQGARHFKNLFTELNTSVSAISLRLSLMCQQTELKMLTAIVTTAKAINGFQDFPWAALFEHITITTGRDESSAISEYLNLIDPPRAEDERESAVENHWVGWTFAHRTQIQGAHKIASFVNVLYCALQLTILVGGNLLMRDYEGLSGHTVSERAVIDNWVQQYMTQRVNRNQVFTLVVPTAAVTNPQLLAIREHRGLM